MKDLTVEQKVRHARRALEEAKRYAAWGFPRDADRLLNKVKSLVIQVEAELGIASP